MILTKCSKCHTLVERSIRFDYVKCFGCKNKNIREYQKLYYQNVKKSKCQQKRSLKKYEKYTTKEEGY